MIRALHRRRSGVTGFSPQIVKAVESSQTISEIESPIVLVAALFSHY